MAGKQQPGGQLRHDQFTLAFTTNPETTQSESEHVRCSNCGRNTTVPRWFKKEGLELHFCTDRCRRLWRDDHRSTVKLKGRPEFRGGNWTEVAQRIRERDAFKCRSCGVTEEDLGRQLDVHHIVPYRAFNTLDRANCPDNLISVCPSCHKKMEEEGHDNLPLFGKGEAPWR
ncbi:MAG: HNH endonuclease [Candidatus Latescibacterota bacterium]|nr:HNH endonuclease [Candidatus Latescibacterota bacterium]